jgi:hypothetical protein
MSLPEYLAKTYPTKWLRYKAGREHGEYRVIEAIGEGVVFNTLAEARGDYMAGIRPRLAKPAKAKAIIAAFGHVDKPYDFDFDFATDHAVVCTELVWRSYRATADSPGLRIDPVDIGGRKTLPANEIVKLFVAEHGKPDRQFDFVYFLDAVEKEGRAFSSGEEEFLQSPCRVKWSFMLD